jgi:hypothetical protein
MAAWLTALSGLVLLVLAGTLLYRRPRLDPAQRQWQRAARRLEKRGLPRHAWEGPQDYAARIAAEMPAVADDIRDIAALYAGLRYGTSPENLLATLHRRVAAFKP